MTFYITPSSKILKDFDEITKFRLVNLFYFTISLCLLAPTMTDLKGEYLAAWVISAFMLFEQISVKLNRYIVQNYTLSTVYKSGVIVHFLYTFGALLIWVNPIIMVYWYISLSLLVMVVFNTYSLMLTSYLTDNFPETMTEFQLIRNAINADAFVIGLVISTLVSYFGGVYMTLLLFFCYNLLFVIRLSLSWNFFDKHLN